MPAPSRSSPARMTCSAASSPCPAATDCAAAAASLVTSAAASDASAAASSRLSCPFLPRVPGTASPGAANGGRASQIASFTCSICEQTSECRWEYRRPPARWPTCAGLRPVQLAVRLLPGNVAVAQRTTSSPPPGIPDLGLSRNDAKGSGERCTLACIDSKKRRYACDEIKLPVKEFDSDRTARDGHTRTARCATPQPEQ